MEKQEEIFRKRDEKLLAEVEDALFRRATGYEDASGKVVPPDVRAAMYWLENRSPGRWKKSRTRENDDMDEKNLTAEEGLL